MKKTYNIIHNLTNKKYNITIDFEKNNYKINTKKKDVLSDLKDDINVNFKNNVYNLGMSIDCNYPDLTTILFTYTK